MLFNSLEFTVFLPLVFGLYWAIGADRRRTQNFVLLVASYVFYGWWDWRFLSLIAVSTLVDYWVGIALAHSAGRRRRVLWLSLSLVVNLGFLGVFKYYNFFIESLAGSLAFFGAAANMRTLSLVLPVGISFYTFQTLSYSIDIYRHQMEPTRDPVAFAAYVAFFPQLVAGPIERARNLLPQFETPRRFDTDAASDGMRQILWGLFKKVAVADLCAPIVNEVFSAYHEYSWPVLLSGAVLFSFQIYGDFSGYSDIAIGTARLFGFSLMRNFAYPYFSRDIAEFWRRWHISLSTWFRDYVYIPLGGSHGALSIRIRNVLVVFLVSGLWHGANWTFVVWGAINGFMLLAMMVRGQNRSHIQIIAKDRTIPAVGEVARVLGLFLLVSLTWVFFRAPSIGAALGYLSRLFTLADGSVPFALSSKPELVVPIAILVAVEFAQRRLEHGLAMPRGPRILRWGFYYTLIAIMFVTGSVDTGIEFIYFQF